MTVTLKSPSRCASAVLFSAVLAGCSTTAHQYSGPQRPDSEIAIIRGVNVVETAQGKPNIVINSWKIGGKPPTSDLSMTHAWGILPGKAEVGATLSLVTLLPMSVRQFQGTYWIPFEAMAGKTYQLYAELKDGTVPREVCAIEIPHHMKAIPLIEGMAMPPGAKVAGCGKPKNPIESYELRGCHGPGTCPVSDNYLKP